MKIVRIRQLEKLVRALQGDGYKVNVFIRDSQKRLVVNVNLSDDNAEEIMAKWNDLRKVEG